MINVIKIQGHDYNKMTVSYYPEASAICSIQKYPIHFDIEIQYAPTSNKLIEFNSLDTWLLSLSDKSFTIETFTAHVFEALIKALGDIPVRVLVHGRTPVHRPASAEMINQGE